MAQRLLPNRFSITIYGYVYVGRSTRYTAAVTHIVPRTSYNSYDSRRTTTICM